MLENLEVISSLSKAKSQAIRYIFFIRHSEDRGRAYQLTVCFKLKFVLIILKKDAASILNTDLLADIVSISTKKLTK